MHIASIWLCRTCQTQEASRWSFHCVLPTGGAPRVFLDQHPLKIHCLPIGRHGPDPLRIQRHIPLWSMFLSSTTWPPLYAWYWSWSIRRRWGIEYRRIKMVQRSIRGGRQIFKDISVSLATSPSQKLTVAYLDALININTTSEHAMNDSLRSVLEMKLPVVSSKKKEEEEEGSVPPFSLRIILCMLPYLI